MNKHFKHPHRVCKHTLDLERRLIIEVSQGMGQICGYEWSEDGRFLTFESVLPINAGLTRVIDFGVDGVVNQFQSSDLYYIRSGPGTVGHWTVDIYDIEENFIIGFSYYNRTDYRGGTDWLTDEYLLFDLPLDSRQADLYLYHVPTDTLINLTNSRDDDSLFCWAVG
jgi:hypothetical protein